jgi:hypothetical protein
VLLPAAAHSQPASAQACRRTARAPGRGGARRGRQRFSKSAWECFERRLGYCISQVALDPLLATEAEVAVGSALNLTDSSSLATRFGPFDVLITSPPYGDSRTTVQYGAASGLSLVWVSQIYGLEEFMSCGRDIDAGCLARGQSRSFFSRHERSSLGLLLARIQRVRRSAAGCRFSRRLRPCL